MRLVIHRSHDELARIGRECEAERHQAGQEVDAEIPAIESIADQLTAVAEAHPDEDVAVAFLGKAG